MSAQRISARTRRRVERATGRTFLMGWAFGGYGYALVTPEHGHYEYDLKTGALDLDPHPLHFEPFCREHWPHAAT